jgi:bifunctional non-homologous end joining protein LigD
MPSFIPPCLPTLRSGVPKGDRWVHEIKFDGYRIQAGLRAGVPSLLTRNGLDWTHRFGAIAEARRDPRRRDHRAGRPRRQ